MERDRMDFDVVIVGAGPAGLACAIHLRQLLQRHNETAENLLEPEIVVLEKGKEVGAHSYSGGVMDPRGIAELLPDWKESGCPVEAPVTSDAMYLLTERRAWKSPFMPPPLRNHDSYVVSLGKMVSWLGEKAESMGVSIFPGFPGRELVMDGDRVLGVQLADAGVGKDGQPKGNFEAGALVLGKVTVLAEGSHGSLSKQLIHKLGLQGQNPQVYATGVKEVWELPQGNFEPGRVWHTMGWPLPSDTFGGGWVYGMGDGFDGGQLVSLGLVTGLDYRDPTTDPHYRFQLFKTHPMLRKLLEGGKMLDYGAKTLPEGGFYAMPKNHGEGFLLIGDSGGFVNGMRLKGIHLAFRSGMLAAEAVFQGLLEQEGDGVLPAARLGSFQEAFEKDWSHRELYHVRNFHQGFAKGRLAGLVNAAFMILFNGRGTWFRDGLTSKASHEHMEKRNSSHNGPGKLPELGTLTFDKVTDVFASRTTHEEDQPYHLVIADPDVCNTRCKEEFGNPCQYFCPASVYEIAQIGDNGSTRLQLNPSNCVHCKTCDIADPYQIINWVTPEGGGGPGYRLL
ncbi:MAG: 4Fe-4S dicluster domain-containing protein [Planctomycetota bacterium]